MSNNIDSSLTSSAKWADEMIDESILLYRRPKIYIIREIELKFNTICCKFYSLIKSRAM